MHKNASLWLALGILAVAAYAVFAAKGWPPKAALFPLAIGVPLFVLAAAEVLWSLLGKAPAAAAADFKLSDDVPRDVALRRTAFCALWVVAFLALIVLLGFPYAVPLFVLLYLKLQAKEGWLFSVASAATVWAVFYGLFDRALHLPFPPGWVFDWLGFA